ncbi:hypothetical protein CPT_Madawaska_123 [Staphylococcus phage Madawaska]|nr:hypothetical protein CPT_Madawaska_123 [Staphylococcus phage Madawaska]
MDVNEYINNHDFYRVGNDGQVFVFNKDISKDELNSKIFSKLFACENIGILLSEYGYYVIDEYNVFLRNNDKILLVENMTIDLSLIKDDLIELNFTLIIKSSLPSKIGPFEKDNHDPFYYYNTIIQIENKDNFQHELISHITNHFNKMSDVDLMLLTTKNEIKFNKDYSVNKKCIDFKCNFNEIYKILNKLEDEKEIKKYLTKENFK